MDLDSDQESLLSSEEEFSLSESESESENEDCLDSVRNWTFIDPTSSVPAPPRFPFIGKPGLKIDIDSIDPLDYFRLFFDESVFMFIADETNKYAERYLSNKELTPSSRLLKWSTTNTKELMSFLGLLLLQGLVTKPVEKLFWSKRPILSTPFFGKVMTEQRYALLMKFLHFEDEDKFDPENHPNTKLRKIFDIYSMIVEKFKTLYVPEENITIDESLIAHKGYLGWKQYIPSKRARFGKKLFQLCEARSGYVWNSIIYTGKGTVFKQEYEKFGLATKTVLTLLHDLKGQGYLLTTDNFYTSPELAELLLQSRTDICGTMRVNRRGLPEQLKKEKIKKGNIIAFQKGKMVALKWCDKKPLLMLSTVHNADFTNVSNKRDKNEKKKPLAVVEYNLNMGGVDKSDQCLSYYPTIRNQQRKYYKKIFRHLINQSVWNAFVLFKKKEGGEMTHLNFRMKLIERLIEEGKCVEEPYVRNYCVKASENVTRLTGRHFPSHIETSNVRKSRKCVVCAQKQNENGKRVRETRFQCEECDVGLCAAPCF